MPQPAGRYLPLPLAQQLSADLSRLARSIPAVPARWTLRLAKLASAREGSAPCPSWTALFTKAYALVAAATPALRRLHVAFPRPCLYEHPVSVACLPVCRVLDGDEVTLFATLRQPERLGLDEIDTRLHHWHAAPLDHVSRFRHHLRAAGWPGPLRRLWSWSRLGTTGPRRARHAGTFALAPGSGLDLAPAGPPVPATTLHHGPVDGRGEVEVCLLYDPRVLDPLAASRALADLERVLLLDLTTELGYRPRAWAA